MKIPIKHCKWCMGEMISINNNFNVYKSNCSEARPMSSDGRIFYRISIELRCCCADNQDGDFIEKVLLTLKTSSDCYLKESFSNEQKCFSLLFNGEFFQSQDHLKTENWQVLKYEYEPLVYNLDYDMAVGFLEILENMHKEFQSDYIFRQDLLRTYINILIHEIIKLRNSNYI